MPKIDFPGASRPDWYDRNPIQRVEDFSNTVAPHGVTVRWTYTVPAGAKAFIAVASVGVIRRTAAGTLAEARAVINLIPSGGSASTVVIVRQENNDVGSREAGLMGTSMVLLAGDATECRTADGSTTGTVTFDVAQEAIEFDA